MPDWVRDYVIIHELMHLRWITEDRRTLILDAKLQIDIGGDRSRKLFADLAQDRQKSNRPPLACGVPRESENLLNQRLAAASGIENRTELLA